MTEAPSTAEAAGSATDSVDLSGERAPHQSRRSWPWFVSIGAVLALVIGLVWAAGGFEYREDLATRVPVGQTFSNGPYEFAFASATIQKTKDYKDQQIWSLVVIGTGRTTGDVSIDPDDDLFVVKDARSGAYQEKTESQQFGVDRSGSGGSLFTPGLAAIPYRLVFQFPVDAFEPQSTITFVSWQLEWRDTSLLQIGDYRWASTHDYFRMDLPLRRLPDDLD